jgi:GNAT superfamily N-acetyltransferase
MNAMLREDEGTVEADVPPPIEGRTPQEEAAARVRFLASRLTEWMQSGVAISLVSAGGSRAAGYVVVEPRDGSPYLRQLYVERGCRRAGIGSAAVRLVLERAAVEGARTMDVAYLSANRPAARFWRKAGFGERVVMLRRETGADRALDQSAGEVSQEIDYHLISGDTEAASAFILDNLRSFNDRVSSYHHAAREPGAVEYIAVMLCNETGAWMGGVCGSVAWGWLEVDDLWIREDMRGGGRGSELLRRIEAEAARRGATRSRLSTFSFQARPFYERHGYRVVGTMDDFPPGGAMYWMRKDGLGS